MLDPIKTEEFRQFLLENTQINWQKIKHFSPEEFDYPNKLSLVMMIKLDYARDIANTKFIPTSDWRDDKGSSHNTGKAIDLSCFGDRKRWIMVNALLEAGFKRIGIYDHHIHADTDESKDERVIWTGKSR